MHHLVYTSQATFTFTDADLMALLRWSWQWNEQAGITGVLVYCNDEFVQVIEGEKAAVDYLYGQLQRDLRHHNLMELVYAPVAERHFAQWTMGFHAAEPKLFAKIKAYLNPSHLEQHNVSLQARDRLLFDLLQNCVQALPGVL